jgi:uncharacterized cupredoxin-like copper-binding protein
VLVLASLLVHCKNDRQPESTERPAEISQTPVPVATPVTITASDFKLELPDTIPAGVVTFNLVNQGKEFHHAQLFKLEDGKTMDDLAVAMKEHGPPPSWMKHLGGPNAAGPGQTITGANVLTPGNYVVLCFIPSPDGQPHVAKGMVRPFTVSGTGTEVAALPPVADTIRLVDYDFQPSRPLKAGSHTFLVENDGPQVHELVVVKLATGKTIQDFAAWAEHLKGPPPAESVGGVTGLDKGVAAQFTADLTPGEYGFICFVPDAKDGKPHLAHGMMKQFKVES